MLSLRSILSGKNGLSGCGRMLRKLSMADGLISVMNKGFLNSFCDLQQRGGKGYAAQDGVILLLPGQAGRCGRGRLRGE